MSHVDRKYEDPTTWRLRSGGTGVRYKLTGMSGAFEAESATAQMNVLVPASQLVQFATEMFPPVYYSLLGFPVHPSPGSIYGTPFYAQRITWKGHVDGLPVDPFGIDPSAPEGTYQSVVACDIDFKTMNEQEESNPEEPQTFLEVSCTGGGHFIHTDCPGGKWKQDENNEIAILDDPEQEELFGEGSDVEPNIPMGMTVPTVDWDLHWPRVPYTYWTNTLIGKIRAALGRVNDANMPIFASAPRGTILFVGYTLRKSYTWRAGQTYQQPFTLGMKFQEKRVVDEGGTVRGHNDFWRPGKGWRFLTHKDGTPIYRYHDLTKVFKP